jgi:hypothetical protein
MYLCCRRRRVACLGSFVFAAGTTASTEIRAKGSRRRREIDIRKSCLSDSKGKLRRAASQARLRRSTEFLLSLRIANV